MATISPREGRWKVEPAGRTEMVCTRDDDMRRSANRERAVSTLRSPTRQHGTSFVSAQIAVQVHTSPASGGAAFAVGTFLCLA